MSFSSSPILARVQGQRGCANITRVATPETREIWLPEGQLAGTASRAPGKLSYFHKAAIPVPMTHSHTAPHATENHVRLHAAVSLRGIRDLKIMFDGFLARGLTWPLQPDSRTHFRGRFSVCYGPRA